jgi:acyl carrier protein
VLATLFSMNASIDTQALFQHRFTRPFVPASERVFLTNPCELYADGKAVTLPTAPESTHPEHNEQETHITTPQNENGALGILYSVVEKQTGFPVSTLQPEHRLLDDLHLDSIKSGELIAHVAQALGCAGSIDPLQLANARLDEIAKELEKASSSTTESTTATSSWVASFQSVRVGIVHPTGSLMEEWSGREFALLGCASPLSSEVEDYLGTLGCQLVRNSPRKLLCLPAEDFESEQSLALLVDVAHRLEANDQLLILDPSPSPIQGSIPTRIDGVRAFASSLHLENPSQHI